ncbi:unnamed protein product (macronuclear) [Paramecium tetraurelia]|uniref:Uncharacterized protein n=1 Tax=Paramecium tetraurelia TaxID=5888 RepID=A0C0I6_PARTE|nr:uncharacterized protein GSPATT00006156001 [Paramecium tetraurelia]CAK64303.1 unnamed protein product [Paramecium tetraurelia]|eukprot:XP_001431701.1 hypothetical protein (macronuclear) [Paramecium tetraurelia strain d4-2]
MLHKITSEINMGEHLLQPAPTQFLSARTIRPSLFLNEADFHLPFISPQKRQITDYQIIKQSLPKSQAVSPVFRKTQTEQDAEDNFLYVKNTVRKLKKQKLYIKEHRQSQQFLPQIEERSEKVATYSTPKNKNYNSYGNPLDSKGFSSSFAKLGALVANQESSTQLSNYTIPKEIEQPQQNHLPIPDYTSKQNTLQQPPHHKKAVSFRKSIVVIDINNGQVSKDQLSENSKPLSYTQRPEIKEEVQEAQEVTKKHIFRRTKMII